jgi:hypothetical protein
MQNDRPPISLDSVEAPDAWGFVGVVRVGDCEAYRTLRSYPVPSEARAAAEQLLANVLGTLLAGQEWRTASDELGHPPGHSELGPGPGPRHPDGRNGQTQPAE